MPLSRHAMTENTQSHWRFGKAIASASLLNSTLKEHHASRSFKVKFVITTMDWFSCFLQTSLLLIWGLAAISVFRCWTRTAGLLGTLRSLTTSRWSAMNARSIWLRFLLHALQRN